jgi:conjugal transfer pilus assembly protein TraB
MTCPTGVANKVITVDVEAFITSRGTGGVRGTVVSREGDAAQRALIAGTLQGLGQAVGSATQRSLVLGADGTAGQGSMTAGEALGGAAGQGLSSAAGQLSQYWIRRAEQYQPVIEMPVGSDVEVVFLGPVTVR